MGHISSSIKLVNQRKSRAAIYFHNNQRQTYVIRVQTCPQCLQVTARHYLHVSVTSHCSLVYCLLARHCPYYRKFDYPPRSPPNNCPLVWLDSSDRLSRARSALAIYHAAAAALVALFAISHLEGVATSLPSRPATCVNHSHPVSQSLPNAITYLL